MSPIDVASLDRFTREEGEDIRHLIGMRCWCVGPNGHPDPRCTEHELGGWIYREERTIRGLVTSIDQKSELVQMGLYLPGDAVFSPTSDAEVSEHDKIIFPWALPYGSGDPLVRGSGVSERLTYEAVRVLYCGDEDKVKYRQDTDFRFVGKTIEWDWAGKPEDGIAPAEGVRYVVKYRAYLEWIALYPPVERISAGVDLGSKVMLRKKHLVEP